MKDEKYWLWLSMLPGIGVVKIKELNKVFKSPEDIWNAKKTDFGRVSFLTHKNVEALTDLKYKSYAEKKLEQIKKTDVKILTISHNEYPAMLKYIYDPPCVMYTRGSFLEEEYCIAIVGSRKASNYGIRVARDIAYQLAKCGVTIVSGMARGIDSAAHSGALEAKGRTIAVLGCGPDVVYPAENKNLMKRIIDSGSVVSEYMPGTSPMPAFFPARNRIISGISLGVVIIEANEKSGSLITANCALEQGREVFAVPGNIGSRNSLGTNALIKEGAKLVMGIDDILEEIKKLKELKQEKTSLSSLKESENKEEQLAFLKELADDEKSIAECLVDNPIHIDELAVKTGMNINMLNSLLIMLELKGIVEQEPGKIFKLKMSL